MRDNLAKASKAARRACLRAALNKEARLVAVAAVVGTAVAVRVAYCTACCIATGMVSREADLTDGTDAARDMGREGGVVRRMEDGGRRFGRALACG